MSFTIEKDWVTEAGLRAVVIVCKYLYEGKEYAHHRRGYVGVPDSHKCFGVDHNSVSSIDCHGALTLSSGERRAIYPVASDLHWFGFDCGHYGDGIIEPTPLDIEFGTAGDRDSVKSLEFCELQCELIAVQLVAIDHGITL